MPLLDELRRRWWLAPLAVIVVVLIFGTRLATFYTDVLWYRSVGFLDVLTTRLLTGAGLSLAAGVFVTLLVGVNLTVARRLLPPFRIPSPGEEAVERYRELLDPFARTLLLLLALFVGVVSALSVAGEWDTFLLWLNAQPFGTNDPQFDRDLGFFLFRLPFWSFLNSWLFTVLAFTIVLTAVAHYLFGGIRPQSPGQKVSPQATVHLSLLLAALVAVRAWGFWLDRYLLSYSERGVVTGLSYTDVNAQLTAYTLLTIISAVCVLLFLANLRYRNFLLPSAGVGILLVAAIVLSGAYPAAIQRFQVDPQELSREEPYIARNLDFTRLGYNITLDDNVATAGFPAANELSAADAEADSGTLEAIRLWDPSVLSSVYAQLQGLRRYFEFADVDVDRYAIDGEQQQINLAVRELDENDLPDQSWQNSHLVYTHGYGVVATAPSASVNGEPEFLVSDIPQQGLEELQPSQPRIYFGEQAPLYSVVRTQQPELDFVSGEEGAEEADFTYDGQDGVGVGSLARRLAFAVRFGEPNFVLSSLLTDESRILFNRNIEQRVRAVAPFLQLDSDPYPVIADGRVQWVLDAYTISDMLPYSTRQSLGDLTTRTEPGLAPQQQPDGSVTLVESNRTVQGLQGRANYIRNSVKAVVDAYDGSITLYVVDPEDPVIAAWQAVFPGSFTDAAEASETLREHFRYPEDLLRVQAQVFATYHVPEAATFYSREDAWQIPPDAAQIENRGDADGPEPPLRPYYLQLRLPGEDAEEFALIQPFNPENRDNLTAWMAARSDPDVYGQLRVYEFPDTESTDGQRQVQALINGESEISAFITLQNESGSEVVYGNLLTIPVGDALLYAQPLFVQAEQGAIPTLRRVVLSLGGRVVYGTTLEEALGELLEGAAPDLDIPGEPEAPEEPGEDPGPVDAEVADLIDQALAEFARAEQALTAGDLGAYQEATARAADLLEQAQELTGGTTPQPEPTPSPDATASPEPTPTEG